MKKRNRPVLQFETLETRQLLSSLPTTLNISALNNSNSQVSVVTPTTQVHSLATVGGVQSGIPLNGNDTIAYKLYDGSGAVIGSWNEPVGTPTPAVTEPAGYYAFSATFNGDVNYAVSWTTTAAAFQSAVTQVTTNTIVTAYNSSGVPVTNVSTGTSIHALAVIGNVQPGTPLNGTDTVTYQLYDGSSTIINTWTEPVGTPTPNVTLGSGYYAFSATFNGDVNYTVSWTTNAALVQVSGVMTNTTTTATVLANGVLITGTVPQGTSIQASVTVGGIVTGVPVSSSATVTYSLYGPSGLMNVWVEPYGTNSPLISLPAGSYTYSATFSGDSNYNASWTATGTPVNIGAPVAGNFTAGFTCFSSATANSITVTTTLATGGTGPYFYQWYRSTTSGFVPGSVNIITGATNVIYTDSNVVAGTIYYYKVVVNDSANHVITSNQALGQTTVSLNTTPGTVTTTLPMVIGLIGDSITAGNGATIGAATWLQTYLNSQHPVTIDNWGAPGSTVASWLGSPLAQAITAFKAEGVTVIQIMLGTNDCVSTTPAQYQVNLNSMISTLQANGFHQIVLMDPPAFNPDAPSNINFSRTESALANLQAYRTVITALSNGTTVFQGDTSAFAFFGENPSDLGDGTHPNDQGTQALGLEWAQSYEHIFAGFTVQLS